MICINNKIFSNSVIPEFDTVSEIHILESYGYCFSHFLLFIRYYLNVYDTPCFKYLKIQPCP